MRIKIKGKDRILTYTTETPQYEVPKLLAAGIKPGAKVELDGRVMVIGQFDGSFMSAIPTSLAETVYLKPAHGAGGYKLFRLGEIAERLALVPDMAAEGFISVHEASRLLGWDEKKVRRMIRQKRLVAVRHGKEWLVNLGLGQTNGA